MIFVGIAFLSFIIKYEVITLNEEFVVWIISSTLLMFVVTSYSTIIKEYFAVTLVEMQTNMEKIINNVNAKLTNNNINKEGSLSIYEKAFL